MTGPGTGRWMGALLAALLLHGVILAQWYLLVRPAGSAQAGNAMAITVALVSDPAPRQPKVDPQASAARPAPQPRIDARVPGLPEPKPPRPTPPLQVEHEAPMPKGLPHPQPKPPATTGGSVGASRATHDVPMPQPPVHGARGSEPAAAQQADHQPGVVTDTPPSYRSKLRAWLARHKVYPRRAQRLNMEGTAVLHFVMDRNGRVLDWSIRSSSGYEMLDAAVATLITSANPMPPLPTGVSMQRLALTVPIRFKLR